MSIILENEYEFDFDVYELSGLLLNRVLDREGIEIEVELNILICDNEEIRRVNREFRGIDRETDVLSFPSVEFERPADFSTVDTEGCSCYDPDTGEFVLGDMMISYEKMSAQAGEYGHSVKREFSFLVVHSILHLLGYDHENEEDEIRMREKQTEILESLHIKR